MQTIQRNFVSNLNNSGFSTARKFKEVQKFLNRKPEVVEVKVLGMKEECLSFVIDTDNVRKVRNMFYATRGTGHKGQVKYEVWEEAVKIYG